MEGIPDLSDPSVSAVECINKTLTQKRTGILSILFVGDAALKHQRSRKMKLFRIVIIILFGCFRLEAQHTINYNYVQGRVIGQGSHLNDTLSGAIVLLSEYNIGTITDQFGRYKLQIPDTLISKRAVVKFKYVGYDTCVRKIRLSRLPKTFNAFLRMSTYNFRNVTTSRKE